MISILHEDEETFSIRERNEGNHITYPSYVCATISRTFGVMHIRIIDSDKA